MTGTHASSIILVLLLHKSAKKVVDRRHAWQLYASIVPFLGEEKLAEMREALRGKNLACWCPLPTEPYQQDECHADVLLKLANKELK